jgi:hypothetical protein
MKSESPEQSNIPLGLGSELEKRKEIVSTGHVKNEVIFVNHDIDVPFKLEEGKEANLGLFLTQNQTEGVKIEKQKTHGRAGILGRVIIGDKEGRNYRDIDMKGIGYISNENIYNFTGTPGILNRKSAEKELEVSEALLKLGVRTSRVMAILRLEEIFDKNDEPITIEEAKKNRLIKETDEPVLEMRLMGTNKRIQDLDDEKNKRLFIDDAKMIVATELGKNVEEFTDKNYLIWFAKNLGTQVGLMHRNNWTHGILTEQNITLDGRIVDFATAQHEPTLKDKDEIDKIISSQDLEFAILTLKDLYLRTYTDIRPGSKKNLGSSLLKNIKEFADLFKESYFQTLDIEEEDKKRLDEVIEQRFRLMEI